MKKEKKEFLSLKRRVLNYNRGLICTFALFMLYALVYSVSVLDCSGIDYYTFAGVVTKDMITCDNMSAGFLTFFINNNLNICIVFLIVAIVLLVLQKLALYKVNYMGVKSTHGEKVKKNNHIVLTLLLGYTGIHKYRTHNRIGFMYSINFIVFILSFVIKCFFETLYTKYLIFYCAFVFSSLLMIGILILNVIEAIFVLLSKKDNEDEIFA